MKRYGKTCDNEGCEEKTFAYRSLCFKCKPVQKAGRKSKGMRKGYLAKLNQKQQLLLKKNFDGSIQALVDEVLEWRNKKTLTKKSS